MSITIPNQYTKQIRQLNDGDLFGELYITKNINLNEFGNIKLSNPAFSILDTDTDSDFTTCDSMFESEDGELFLNSTNVFSGTLQLSSFTDRGTDTGVPTPGVNDDGVFFNGTEVISDNQYPYYRSASTTWTQISLSSVLDNSYPKLMCVFDDFNSLLVANHNTVKRIDSNWIEQIELTLPSDYVITAMDASGSYTAIGARNISGQTAKIFIWDGSTTAYNNSFNVEAGEIFAIRKADNGFVGITSKGQLIKFNSGSYTELAHLPIYHIDTNWADTVSNNHSVVSNRGLKVDGENIYIRLDNRIYDQGIDYTSVFPGGVWRYNPRTGLNCVYTPSFSKMSSETIATSAVNTSTDVITVTTAPTTGTPIIYNKISGTVLGGLKDLGVYYAIKLTSTTIKLATSRTNANAGTAIDLTGTGNNNQKLFFFSVNDYGWTWASDRGAIETAGSVCVNGNYFENKVFTADLFAKQSTTDKTVLNALVKRLPNIGYFVTVRSMSSGAKDGFGKMTIKFLPLGEDDRIIIKTRTKRNRNLPINSIAQGIRTTGVWSDTNTFTTTLDLSNASVGDEVEIVAGVGAGWMAHITELSENSGTWTVSLDDTFKFASANDIFYFTIDNWTKQYTLTSHNTDDSGFFSKTIDESGKDIQFKVVVDGIGVLIEEFKLDNKSLQV